MEKDYYEVRATLLEAVKKELIGPGSEEIGPDAAEEIITESPDNRYTLGMLFPQSSSAEEETASDEGNLANGEEDEPQDFISLANQYYPSAMGISFYSTGISPEIKIEISAASYRKITEEDEGCIILKDAPETITGDAEFKKRFRYDGKKIYVSGDFTEEERNYFLNLSEDRIYKSAVYKLYAQKTLGWKRLPLSKAKSTILIGTGSDRRINRTITESLDLVCIRRPDKENNRTLFTVSLVNTAEAKKQRCPDKTFFQVGFKVSLADSEKNKFLEYESESKFLDDPEFNSYRLLYSKRKEFATGHGCSAGWNFNADSKTRELYTETIPSYEVPNIGFDIPELTDDIAQFLVMKNLSDISDLNKEQIIVGLGKFCELYGNWINTQEEERAKIASSELSSVAQVHINRCKTALKRMSTGIALLKNNQDVFRAFQWANRAMFMQRLHSDLQKNKRFPEEPNFQKADYEKVKDVPIWRPFQLAFILLSLESISNPKCLERETVDLIWFATAGGKTEAYLGITAFTIFLRRLKNAKSGGGTAVLMRYTLRLLASQQFQRATTLICACETIRKENQEILGEEKITIGLWVGSSLTPNSTKDAFESLKLLIGNSGQSNPFQLFSCPWCGTKLVKEGRRGKWGYREGRRPSRFIIKCTESQCEFQEELPVRIVDEDIYNNPPTLLFGTVDKFALMPWKGEVANIFALNKNNGVLSPELIIQDELHLIEGPLGTVVGLYETALDILCSAKGIKPKIIASTATIKKAGEQCAALYRREVSQFPPPGLYAEDSFFAREIPLADKPGRLFAGIMSSGRTHVTTLVRFLATALQAAYDVKCEEKTRDPYWTLVGYYNTLRELGHNLTLVNDDVNDYLMNMAKRRGVDYRRIGEPVELTSRIDATHIPELLERLFVGYPNKTAIQILLATNMIATGVDIDRLALMMVAGQPKTTAEYIQASSRIGRMYPGLVFTVYNGTKPRDRSHYEHFRGYHQAFYRYVEPTTVTPFSGPARDRALHAVVIALVRHLGGFNRNTEASKAIKEISPEMLEQIKKQITERVTYIDDRESEQVMRELVQIIEKWKHEAELSKDLLFGSLGQREYATRGVNLLTPSNELPGVWRTLTSMRDVDAACAMEIIEE
ncbi:MAG: helicase-related protein [Patescibacteria group bacterium]